MPNWRVFKVSLNDEIPRVGSGLRVVEAEVGKKWVRVRRRTRYDGPKHLRTSRLSLHNWNALNPELLENEDVVHHSED